MGLMRPVASKWCKKDDGNLESNCKNLSVEIFTQWQKTERRNRVLLMVEVLLCCTFYPGTGRLAG